MGSRASFLFVLGHSLFAAGVLLTAACGSDRGTPSTRVPAGTGQPDAHLVNGSERLQWSQAVPDSFAIHRYSYVAYVDGTQVPLRGSVCSPHPDPAGYACSAPLPQLTPGRHILELATIDLVDDVRLESARSAPISVELASPSSAAAARGDNSHVHRFVVGGTAHRVDTVVRGLTMPAALAALPDGRLIVAEQSGVIRIVRPGEEPRVALAIDDLRDGGQTIVQALTVHPSFARNRVVLVLYTSVRQDGAAMRLVRFRELNDALGEPAVVLDDLPADSARPAGAMAVTADGEVYVATGGIADPSADRVLAGKILRLNMDGTVPRDAPAASPVHADAADEPLGVGINSLSGRLWLLSGGERTERTPLEIVSRPTAAAAVQYRGNLLVAFQNDMVVTRADGLERLHYDAAHGMWNTEGLLLSGWFGRLGAVAEGSDGALYVATANSTSADRPGIDRLLRILPDREPGRRRR